MYIGKAVNLKRRVRQYFAPAGSGWDNRIRSMVSGIVDLDWICTVTELEALLLEDSLIKKHWPDFNTRQKKFLRHTYLSFSNDRFPVLMIKDRPANTEDDRLYGPITDIHYAGELADCINTALGLRRCTDPQPNRRCIYEAGECLGPCSGSPDPEIYRDRVELARGFLSGGNRELLDIIAERMQLCSDRQEYRSAAGLRDRLSFCRRFWSRQNFFRRFQRDKLLIEEIPQRFFLFLRGRFCGVRGTRRELAKIPIPKEETGEDQSILFDRAMVVLAWLNSRRTAKKYQFLDTPRQD